MIIDERIEVFVVDIRGDQVKLGINAPKDVKVFRKEVFEAIQAQNLEAAMPPRDLPNLNLNLDALED